MSYSAMAHALVGYVEGHLGCFDIENMSKCFGFSESYLRELFLKNVEMPIMQYYKQRKLILSAFELLHSDKKIIDIAATDQKETVGGGCVWAGADCK